MQGVKLETELSHSQPYSVQYVIDIMTIYSHYSIAKGYTTDNTKATHTSYDLNHNS